MGNSKKKFDIGTPRWIKFVFDLMMFIAIGLSVSVILDIGGGAIYQLLSGEITFKGIMLILQPLLLIFAIFAIFWMHSMNATMNESGFRKKGLFRSFELPFESIEKIKFMEKRGVILQGKDGNYIGLNDINLDDSDDVHCYLAKKLKGRDDIDYEEKGGIFWHTESEVKEIYLK